MTGRIDEVLRSPRTLAAAAILVGIAIIWDGSGARLLNGAGGIIWVGSFIVIARDRWRTSEPRRNVMAATVLMATAILAVLVRPSDGLIALVGFGAAGAVVGLIARRDVVEWSVLVPAAWLPLHLVIAIGTSVVQVTTGGDSVVRTDPPPTTAFVPLLMVIAAWGAGLLVQRLRCRTIEVRTVIRDAA